MKMWRAVDVFWLIVGGLRGHFVGSDGGRCRRMQWRVPA